MKKGTKGGKGKGGKGSCIFGALGLVLALLLTGCVGGTTATTTGGAPVGLTDDNVKAIHDASRDLSALAIQWAVSPADKVEVTQQIHDVALQIETFTAFSGVLPSTSLDAGIKSVLPTTDWATNFRNGLVSVYRTWGTYGARVLSAMAAGLADATGTSLTTDRPRRVRSVDDEGMWCALSVVNLRV